MTIVKFTETILGRFLQGVNFYLLVLSSLLALFMPPWKTGRVSSFHPISPKPPVSSFNVSQPSVSIPDIPTVQPRFSSPIILQSPTDIPTPSPARKISGWLATQKKRLSGLSGQGDSQVDVDAQLWKKNRA